MPGIWKPWVPMASRSSSSHGRVMAGSDDRILGAGEEEKKRRKEEKEGEV